MTLIITLFIIGLVCLTFELITPGALLGVLGGIAMLIGCAIAWNNYGAAWGMLSILIALILAGITIYTELVLIPKTKFGRQMFNSASISGTSQPPPASADVIGRECEAATILAPTGYVLLDGKRYEARSLDGLVDKGAHLRVNSLDNFTLQVTKLWPTQTHNP